MNTYDLAKFIQGILQEGKGYYNDARGLGLHEYIRKAERTYGYLLNLFHKIRN